MRILIADDHEMIRKGIRALLEVHPGWKICGEAADGREALQKTAKLRPHVLILNINMPGMSGLEAIPRIVKARPKTRILVFTMHDSERTARIALAAGASGVVLKCDAARELVKAVETVGNNEPYLSPKIAEIMLGGLAEKSRPEPLIRRLSSREVEILRILAEGKSSKEAANLLDISPKTVDAHRANIMRKLKLKSFSELIRFAVGCNLVEV